MRVSGPPQVVGVEHAGAQDHSTIGPRNPASEGPGRETTLATRARVVQSGFGRFAAPPFCTASRASGFSSVGTSQDPLHGPSEDSTASASAPSSGDDPGGREPVGIERVADACGGVRRRDTAASAVAYSRGVSDGARGRPARRPIALQPGEAAARPARIAPRGPALPLREQRRARSIATSTSAAASRPNSNAW